MESAASPQVTKPQTYKSANNIMQYSGGGQADKINDFYFVVMVEQKL